MAISKKRIAFVDRAIHKALFSILFMYISLVGYCQVTDIDVPRIRWVSVDINTGEVHIRWDSSSTPGVKYYTVRYGRISSPTNLKLSWLEVDGVKIYAGSDLYHSFDPSGLVVNPNSQPVVFAVKAHIDEDTTSQVDLLPWDSTLFVHAEMDTCLAEARLTWNRYDYNMWPKGTNSYNIFISEDEGLTYRLLDVVSPDTQNYTVHNIEANRIYKFYVAAFSDNIAGDSATSNSVQINTHMARNPEYIHADYATFLDNNAQLNFSIDPNSQLKKYNLLRSVSPGGTFDSIIQLTPVNNQILYTDKIDYTAGPYYYQLEAINFCNQGISISENTASTIVLAGSGEPISPVLSWNGYTNWINGVEHYSIERKLTDGDFSQLENTNQTTFTDEGLEELSGTGIGSEVCYRVTALENNNPYGVNASSLSNEICFELPVNIRMEYDAFMPGNETDNNTFGPSIDYLPDDYKFEILDRSGNVVYESSDPNNTRWNGKIKGLFAPAGAYMYVIQYHIGQGKSHVLRGGLVVVYP